MKSVFAAPFATRIYPSPRTGDEVTVYVKEVPIDEDTKNYFDLRVEAAEEFGHHLLWADTRGGRAWSVAEHLYVPDKQPRQHPWVEAWEILTRDQIAVLDLIMFTDFYSDRTIARFNEFAQLALPLIEKYGAQIRRADHSGVELDVKEVGPTEWDSLAAKVMAFNEKHFSIQQPREYILGIWKTHSCLWFGFC